MPTIKQLEDQGRALLADQRALVDDESRQWSEKTDEYNRLDEDIKAILDQHAAAKSVETDPFALVSEDAKPVDRSPKSMGQQVVDSAGYQGRGEKGSRFSVDAGIMNATLTETTGGAGAVVPTYQTTPVNILFRRLVVADLFPQGSIDGNTLIYVKESTVTNAAAAVAEGAAKPASDLNLVQVTETVKKIATTLKVTDEMFDDQPAMRSYVDARLSLFVQLAEEDQLLNGSGTGANMTGILNRSGKQTAVAVGATPVETKRADSIYNQITQIRANAFLEPDAIVIHPTDWQTIRLNKDANFQYFGGGPFTGAYGNGAVASDSLWGLRVVVTPAMTVGTALVGAFAAGAQVFRKGGLRVEMTNSNEDDFLKNLVAIRAEERLALAVYRPGAFGTVTGL